MDWTDSKKLAIAARVVEAGLVQGAFAVVIPPPGTGLPPVGRMAQTWQTNPPNLSQPRSSQRQLQSQLQLQLRRNDRQPHGNGVGGPFGGGDFRRGSNNGLGSGNQIETPHIPRLRRRGLPGDPREQGYDRYSRPMSDPQGTSRFHNEYDELVHESSEQHINRQSSSPRYHQTQGQQLVQSQQHDNTQHFGGRQHQNRNQQTGQCAEQDFQQHDVSPSKFGPQGPTPSTQGPPAPQWPIQTIDLVNLIDLASDEFRIYQAHRPRIEPPEEVSPLLATTQTVNAMGLFSGLRNGPPQDLVVIRRRTVEVLSNWIGHILQNVVTQDGPAPPTLPISYATLINVVNLPSNLFAILDTVALGEASAEQLANAMARLCNGQLEGRDLVVMHRRSVDLFRKWVSWVFFRHI